MSMDKTVGLLPQCRQYHIQETKYTDIEQELLLRWQQQCDCDSYLKVKRGYICFMAVANQRQGGKNKE
jgi:hypothetical protein